MPTLSYGQQTPRCGTRARLTTALTALAWILTVIHSPAATVSWSGAGGDDLWSNLQNWNGGLLPNSDDDVVINVPGDATVRMDVPSTSVRSLQCQESFLLEYGPFRVTAGASVINGAFRMNFGQTLAVDGATAVLTANGAVTSVAGLQALNGGVIALPSARELTVDGTSALSTYSYSWLYANGGGSAIHLTNLTNLVIAPYYFVRVDASGGGRIDLRQLRVPEGPIQVTAQSTNTLVNLSGMTGLWTQGPDHPLGWWRGLLSAGDGGTVLIPNVTAFNNVDLTVSDSANVNLAQIRSFTDGSLSLRSRTNGLDGLTNFSGRLNASDTRLRLTNITAIHATSAYPGVAADQGSLIDLSRVTNVVNDTGYYFDVAAYSGGRIDLQRMRVPQGLFSVTADQAGSAVDLSGLNGEWTAQNSFYNSVVRAWNGGSVLISNVTAMRNINLDLRDDAVVPTAQIRSLTDGSITLYRCTNSFAGLTNLDGSSVWADDGGTILIPNVTVMNRVSLDLRHDAMVPTEQLRSFTDGYITLYSRTNGFAGLTNFTGYFSVSDTRLDLTNFTVLYATNNSLYLQADQGSFIDLSRLTNVVTSSSGYSFAAYASGGSRIDLHRLRVSEGPVSVSASGTDSLVDLSGFNGVWRGSGAVTAGSGGTVLMPNVTALAGVSLNVSDSANVNLDQLDSITSATITLRSRTNDLTGLTNFTGAFNAYDSRLYLTNLTVLYVTNHMSITADQGSWIDLSRITNVVMAGQYLVLNAYSGGRIDLSRLQVPRGGSFFVDARGLDSLVDLSGFSGLWDEDYQVSVRASSGATVAISNVTAMRGISLDLSGDANVPMAQLRSFTQGGIQLSTQTNVFAGLTNFTGTVDCSYDSGAEFPSLSQLNTANYSVYFSARNGGVIDLSQVTNAVVEPYGLALYAYYGGRIEIPNLESIVAGQVDVRAEGTDAVVDLSRLTGFFSDNNSGSLRTVSGGTILLNSDAMLLAGVAIDFQSNPGDLLPPFLAPSQSLVIYGQPWQSYRVESRNPSVTDSPWSLYKRVPLTGPLQILSARPPRNLALRVHAFIADPSEVDIRLATPGSTETVLYGVPDRTYLIETTMSLSTGGWQDGPTRTMTNSFFIFPGAGATNDARFYRARQL